MAVNPTASAAIGVDEHQETEVTNVSRHLGGVARDDELPTRAEWRGGDWRLHLSVSIAICVAKATEKKACYARTCTPGQFPGKSFLLMTEKYARLFLIPSK